MAGVIVEKPVSYLLAARWHPAQLSTARLSWDRWGDPPPVRRKQRAHCELHVAQFPWEDRALNASDLSRPSGRRSKRWQRARLQTGASNTANEVVAFAELYLRTVIFLL